MNPTDPATVTVATAAAGATGATAVAAGLPPDSPLTWLLVIVVGPAVGTLIWLVRTLVTRGSTTIEAQRVALVASQSTISALTAALESERDSSKRDRDAVGKTLAAIQERNRPLLREFLEWRERLAGGIRANEPGRLERELSDVQGSAMSERSRLDKVGEGS